MGNLSLMDASEASALLEKALQSIKIKELAAAADSAKQGTPHILEHSMAPLDAFHEMAKREFGACPVQDGDKKLIGTLDLRDAVKFVVDVSSKKDDKDFAANIAVTGGNKKSQIKGIESHPEVQKDNAGVSYLARMRPFKVYPEDSDLVDVAKVLSSGRHIVGCSDQDGALGKIITQKMLFAAVAPGLKAVTLHVEAIMTSPVISVKCDASAFEAFEAMTKRDVSGLAVVDSKGHLIHNVSTNDIKLWVDHESDHDLDINKTTIEDFLVTIRSSDKVKATAGKTRVPVCTVHPGESVGHAVGRMQSTGYHHVWVVDTNKKPVGVISMTDLFKMGTFVKK